MRSSSPRHKALIVCINDATHAQFLNTAALAALGDPPLKVEYLYNDTSRLDRNYFRLLVSKLHPTN